MNIVVLGFHISETSLVSSFLDKLGFFTLTIVISQNLKHIIQNDFMKITNSKSK